MRHIKLLLFYLRSAYAIAQDAVPAPPQQTQPQLTQVPPKPTCNPNNIFTGNDCQTESISTIRRSNSVSAKNCKCT